MKRRIALVAVAVVLALVGTIAVYSYANHADQRAVAATRAAKVLVAQKRISAGTSWSDVLKGGDVQQEQVPADAAPSGAIADLGAAVGKDEVAASDIAPGQIVLRLMFGQQSAVTGALPIPAGKVAVSVTMPTNADVAGYVQYQSEVAVYATYKLAAKAQANSSASVPKGTLGGTDLYTTKMLLPRVEVIATSQAAPSGVDGSSNKSSLTGSSSSSTGNVLVTLALTQDEAEKLILSQQVGQLYLALLSDNSVTAPDTGTIGIGVFHSAPIFVK